MLGIIAEGKGGRRRILHGSEELIWRMEALPECFGVWKFHEFPGLLDYQPVDGCSGNYSSRSHVLKNILKKALR